MPLLATLSPVSTLTSISCDFEKKDNARLHLLGREGHWRGSLMEEKHNFGMFLMIYYIDTVYIVLHDRSFSRI